MEEFYFMVLSAQKFLQKCFYEFISELAYEEKFSIDWLMLEIHRIWVMNSLMNLFRSRQMEFLAKRVFSPKASNVFHNLFFTIEFFK